MWACRPTGKQAGKQASGQSKAGKARQAVNQSVSRHPYFARSFQAGKSTSPGCTQIRTPQQTFRSF